MSYYTSEERKRMAEAVSAGERCRAFKASCERLAMLATVAIVIFLMLAMFYVATN